MKTYAKNLLLTTAVTAALVGGALITKANAAADADIPVKVTTRSAIVVEKTGDMDFGQLDIIIADQEGKVVLKAEDGSIDVTDTNDTVEESGGTPTAGEVTIQTDGESIIDITCTAGSVENGTDSLDIVELTVFGDTGSTTAETDCTTAAAAVTATAEEVILKVGATIDLGVTPAPTGNLEFVSGATAPNVAAAYQ